MSIKYGKVLTYKDIEEAKKLIGKKVFFSDILLKIEDPNYFIRTGCAFLTDVLDKEYEAPFVIAENRKVQFIREVIEEEPQYSPLNWEEAQGILGQIVHRKRGTYSFGEYEEYRVVTSVSIKAGDEVQIMGLTAEQFLEQYEFTNGKPCGVEVEE